MAGVLFNVVTGELTTGTSVKTLAQVIAAANQRVLVHAIEVSFKGVSTTDAPILVEVLRQTTAGTVTSLTPVKNNNGDDETLQTTASKDASAEPTAGDILRSLEVHPQGRHTIYLPRPIVVKGGGRLGVRVTAAVSVSACVSLECEE